MLSQFRRRNLWLAAPVGVVTLVLVAAAALHTAPMRARMLSILLARLSRTGIVARAEQLDYNLLTLDVRLYRVTLAAASAPTEPFFTADQVHTVPSWRALLGRVDLKLVELVRPRIVLKTGG